MCILSQKDTHISQSDEILFIIISPSQQIYPCGSPIFRNTSVWCPFTHATFVALLYATFVAPEFRDENRRCKLAAISMRSVAAMSQRNFEHVRKVLQIGGARKTEGNMAHQ